MAAWREEPSLGREQLPWSDDVWSSIDTAVNNEVQRTCVAAKIIPLQTPAGIVTLTSDGLAAAQAGLPARITSRVERRSPVAKHRMPRSESPDRRQLPRGAARMEVSMDECKSGEEILGLLGRFEIRCICRSRRRVGRCEFSARLFRYRLCRCSVSGSRWRFATP